MGSGGKRGHSRPHVLVRSQLSSAIWVLTLSAHFTHKSTITSRLYGHGVGVEMRRGPRHVV